MALTVSISQKELKRKADLAYDNKTYKVFLALNDASYTAETTAANWLTKELAVTAGYAAVTGTITTASGAYDNTDARYEFPAITATFTASGVGFTYNTVVIRIGSETYVVGVLVESPSITLLAGQSKTYSITLGEDD
tara:strand:- start:35 stop:445 length:411 start_codon:yes stop_codon:yes gene_type:complete